MTNAGMCGGDEQTAHDVFSSWWTKQRGLSKRTRCLVHYDLSCIRSPTARSTTDQVWSDRLTDRTAARRDVLGRESS